MGKPNYGAKKRQKELARKEKREQKMQRKLERKGNQDEDTSDVPTIGEETP